MSALIHDIKHALITLKTRPVFFFSIVISLGITLGAVVCAFSLNFLLLIKPLPYSDQERLVVANQVRLKDTKVVSEGFQNYPSLVDWYKTSDVFEIKSLSQKATVQLTRPPQKPKISAAFVTPEYFHLSNAPLMMGRFFNNDEGLNQHAPAAVITEELWRTHFNATPNILKQKVSIGRISHPIVGVLDGSFKEPYYNFKKQKSLLFLPWDFNSHNAEYRKDWTNFSPKNNLIGKLKQGISFIQAQEQLTKRSTYRFTDETIGRDFWRGVRLEAKVVSFDEAITGNSKATSLLFFAGVLALLAIAITNAINLFLSRTAERQRQLAIQAALGANKTHVFTTILAETSVLMISAILVALITAQCGFDLLLTYGSKQFPRLNELSFDLITLSFTIIVGLSIASLFAWLATNLINYQSLASVLQSSGKGSGLQISTKIRRNLIATQVGLALLLLVGNFTLLSESISKITRPLGYNTHDTVTMSISTGGVTLSTNEKIAERQVIKQALQNHPKIDAASSIDALLLAPSKRRSAFPKQHPKREVRTSVLSVDQDFIDTSQLPLLKGTVFRSDDIINDHPIAMISQSLAIALFGTDDVVGKRLLYSSNAEPKTVTGVVKDIQSPWSHHIPEVLYLPSSNSKNMSFLIRAKEGDSLSKQEINRIIGSINPQYSLYFYKSTKSSLATYLQRDKMMAVITSALSVLTVFLATIGLYGVLNYSINLRKYDLGVRMAIGAKPLNILALLILDTLRAVGLGILLGGVASLVSYAILKKGYHLAITIHPIAILAALLLVIVTVIVAVYLPSAKVIRRYPIHSLTTTQ